MRDGGAAGKIYVRETEGLHTNWRWACIWLTQLVFYGLPWLNWNARQLLCLDLAAGKFYVFGMVFWPQDGIYLVAALLMAACALFLSSALYGRLWCGFACPHTVYTELFMWIENRIEGGPGARMRLDRGPLTRDKLRKKTLKHGAWLALAWWTGFTFAGYFTPIRALLGALGAARLGPWEAFWILLYGALAYGNAGWAREQFCKYICPHARFQSVLSDSDTLVIAYDAARGEPRGLRNRKQLALAREQGDCVDCTLCVQVCPSGSDIRQGFHYECIGCAACIDACNLVMDKIGAPRGLIRYASENALRDPARAVAPWRGLLRARPLAYGGVLLALALALGAALALRAPLRVDVMLDRNLATQPVQPGGAIENVYRLQVMNADERAHRYRVALSGLAGAALAGADTFELDALAARMVPLRVRLPAGALPAGPAAPGAAPTQAAPTQAAPTQAAPILFTVTEQDGARRGVAEAAVFPLPR